MPDSFSRLRKKPPQQEKAAHVALLIVWLWSDHTVLLKQGSVLFFLVTDKHREDPLEDKGLLLEDLRQNDSPPLNVIWLFLMFLQILWVHLTRPISMEL